MKKHTVADPYANLETIELRVADELFAFIRTLDKSWSLSIFPGGYTGDLAIRPERMHHPKGALEETVEIYGRMAKWVLSNRFEPRFAVVGLGLGYIEMVIVCAWLSYAKTNLDNKPGPLRLVSFESHPVLRQALVAWLNQEFSSKYNGFFRFYDDIEIGVANQFSDLGFKAGDLRAELARLFTSGQWELRGALSPSNIGGDTVAESKGETVEPVTAIMFDAFSSKTSGDLWSEEFFESLIKTWCLPTGGFASFAAKGTLNRSLKVAGFDLIPTSGYGGKRESTFAVRSSVKV